MEFDNQVVEEIESIYDIHIDEDLVKRRLRSKKEKEVIKNLEKVVNKSLVDIFELGIKTHNSIILNQKDLQRRVGKTITLRYLALVYDLPIITRNSSFASKTRNNPPYSDTNIRVYSQYINSLPNPLDEIEDDIILIDECSLDVLSENMVYFEDKTFIGFLE